jgi:hypothetical protein
MCTPIERHGVAGAQRLLSNRAALLSPAAVAITVLFSACSRDLPTEPDAKGAPRAQADVTATAVPSNDDIEDATVIGSLPFTDNVNTEDATTQPDDPDCVGNGPTVWYRFTPAATIRINANTFGSDYDTSLSVYTGSPGDLTQIACNDDAGGLQSSVTFEAAAGETYFIMVGAFGSGPGGNLTLTVDEAPPPLEADLAIARFGSVNARTGVAIVRGRVTCSRAAVAEISGQLRQRVGRVFLTAEFFTFVECDGQTAWEVELTAENGLLKGGPAQVVAGALFFDPVLGEFGPFVEEEARVQLRGRGRPR